MSRFKTTLFRSRRSRRRSWLLLISFGAWPDAWVLFCSFEVHIDSLRRVNGASLVSLHKIVDWNSLYFVILLFFHLLAWIVTWDQLLAFTDDLIALWLRERDLRVWFIKQRAILLRQLLKAGGLLLVQRKLFYLVFFMSLCLQLWTWIILLQLCRPFIYRSLAERFALITLHRWSKDIRWRNRHLNLVVVVYLATWCSRLVAITVRLSWQGCFFGLLLMYDLALIKAL